MASALYMGFAHLIRPETTTLVAQDDHVLGQERYPLNAWQGDEVIRERYVVSIPVDVPAGAYEVWLGIYTWPDLQRLDVPGTAEDVVKVGSIVVDR